jgi:hypothetical protein
MFNVPDASDVVVIVSGDTPVAAAIVNVNDFSAVCCGVLLSFTSAVKKDVPSLVGVPEIVPLLPRVKPVGRAPATKLHVYGVVPPVASRGSEYAVPSFPEVRNAGVIWSALAAVLISTEKLFVAVFFGASESVTAATNEKAPAFVGVPEITPAALKVRPLGIAPELMLQA